MSRRSGSSDHSSSRGLDRFQHPWFTRFWLRVSPVADRRGGAEYRRRLVSGATGRVIEIGAGDGRNFAHYPPSVTEVLAIEPDDSIRPYAERNATSAPVPVRVVAGHADALPGDAEFDCAVLSQVLCSVPDADTALRQTYRALRPGGQVHFWEHVRSRRPRVAAAQKLIAPLWRRLCGGCEPHRDATAAIERAGFTFESVDRFPFRPGPLLRMTYMLGTATRDGAQG